MYYYLEQLENYDKEDSKYLLFIEEYKRRYPNGGVFFYGFCSYNGENICGCWRCQGVKWGIFKKENKLNDFFNFEVICIII